MREILFRGKPLDKKHFVYGSLGVINDNLYAIYWCNEFIDDTKILVDKQTVGQYTGLTDMNGTKIFEGDIIRSTFDGKLDGLDCGTGQIEFYKGSWYVYGNINNGLYDIEKFNDLEIIGSIYDNSELSKDV